MVAKNSKVYLFSLAKYSVAVLLLGLLAALLFGLWFLNGSVYKPPWTPSQVAYGVNVDMTAMIPGTPYTVMTASGGNFFDLAAQLGINTLRITDVQWALSGKEHSQAAWRYVFTEAENHHLNNILLLVGGGEHSAIEHAHTLLDHYGLAHAPARWLVDLDNEPNLSDPRHMTEPREEAAYVHQVAPTVPVTIGGWKSEVLLEEFGAGNGLAPTTDPTPTGSPEWQASVYRGVLQEVAAQHDQGVLGAVAWIIAPRPAWPNSESYERDMTGWAFALNRGQRLLPAAREFAAVSRAIELTTNDREAR
jgi:hypothetical protein